MGLDIYLRKFTKPSIDTTKTYTTEELDAKGLSYISIERNNNGNRLPQDIIDNCCQTATIIEELLDNEKLLPYFKEQYPETYADVDADNLDLYITAFVPKDKEEDAMAIMDDNHTINGFYSEVTIISRDKQFDITKDVPTQAYIYQTEEVAYQRKGLNDYGWSLLPDNCTYSTDYDNLVELVTDGGLSRSFLDNWIEGETALVAWW